MQSSVAPAPVVPNVTWGMSLSRQEKQRILRETYMLKLLNFSTADSRQRRFVPISFLLNLDGVTHQFFLRFRSGLKSFSLPEGYILQSEDFEIILFRRWTLFRSSRDYGPLDYPFFVPNELKTVVMEALREFGYIDHRGRLVESSKGYLLPHGSTVLSSRVAIEQLKKMRKVT